MMPPRSHIHTHTHTGTHHMSQSGRRQGVTVTESTNRPPFCERRPPARPCDWHTTPAPSAPSSTAPHPHRRRVAGGTCPRRGQCRRGSCRQRFPSRRCPCCAGRGSRPSRLVKGGKTDRQKERQRRRGTEPETEIDTETERDTDRRERARETERQRPETETDRLREAERQIGSEMQVCTPLRRIRPLRRAPSSFRRGSHALAVNVKHRNTYKYTFILKTCRTFFRLRASCHHLHKNLK